MNTMTNVGIIDVSIPVQVEFAMKYLDYELEENVRLNYELHFEEKNESLSLLIHEALNKVVTQIMFIKSSKHHYTT